MRRETREGILRTAFVTHHAKHGVMLPMVDEIIERICDAMDEQDKRDATAAAAAHTPPAFNANNVDFAGMTPTSPAAKPVDKKPCTMQDIFDDAIRRAERTGSTPPFEVVSQAWKDAAYQLMAGDPNKVACRLRLELECLEERIRKPLAQIGCSGPSRARDEDEGEARRIRAMLDLLADEYGVERVWADTMQ